jgi:hypothetical protein
MALIRLEGRRAGVRRAGAEAWALALGRRIDQPDLQRAGRVGRWRASHHGEG